MSRRAAALLLFVSCWFLIAPEASACPVCYGAPGDPMVKATNYGVWVLLGFVFFVQIGFVALFWSFWRRGKELKKFRDQFQLINGGVR